jgi:hypothetical protein
MAGTLLVFAQKSDIPTEDSTTSQQAQLPAQQWTPPPGFVRVKPQGPAHARYRLIQGRYLPHAPPNMRGGFVPIPKDTVFKIDTETGQSWKFHDSETGGFWKVIQDGE